MNRRLSTCLVLSGALLWSAGLAKAQEAAPPPPPPMAMLQTPGEEVGIIGERIEFMGFEGMHGGKVVTGAPFSGVAVSESTQTLADGNHITRKTQTNLFRDAQGRVRREVTLPAIGPLATPGEPKSFVFIHDPVANSSYILHPDMRSAEKLGKPFGGMRGGMHGAMNGNMVYRKEEASADGNLKREDLGTQAFASVSAQGTRITRTIPAGEIGNDKPIQVISERWYSPELQIVVKSTRNDPRFGMTTYTVTNIQKTEPDASLFTIPADYTVKEGGRGPGGRHRHGVGKEAPPPAPPAPND
jgi:hypothetical protein